VQVIIKNDKLFASSVYLVSILGKQIAGGIFHDTAVMPHNEIFISYVQKSSRCGTTLSAHLAY